jgi:hypothetical protein
MAMHQSRSETWDGAEQATTRIDTKNGIHMLRIAGVPHARLSIMALWRIGSPEA